MNVDDHKAAARSSSADELRAYAGSQSPAVRLAVAENSSTGADTLLMLSSASELDVRTAALRRLPADEADRLEAGRNAALGIAIDAGPRRPAMPMTTLHTRPGRHITESRGLVFGSSSRVAWGLNKQSDRLTYAMSAALLDLENSAQALKATAVVGVTFALNSSAGSSVNILGSSEGVLVMGTAVVDSEG